MLGVVAFLVVASVVMLSHEVGHFAAAKAAGVRVDEFGLGLPPRIAVLANRHGTLYTLNAIPFGAFVNMPEACHAMGDEAGGGSFRTKGLRARFTILAAGPLMNVFLALVLLTLAFRSGYPEPLDYAVLVTGVADASPAGLAGIREGDLILAIDGQEVESTEALKEAAAARLGQEVCLTVRRPDAVEEVTVVPREDAGEGQGPMGITIATVPITVKIKRHSWQAAFREGTSLALESMAFLVAVPILVATRLMPPSAVTPAGVPTIARALGQAAEQGIGGGWWFPILRLAGVLSVSLAVTNLLPLPGLDGGRVLFLVLEALRGKSISLNREEKIHRIGLVILLGMAFVLAAHELLDPSPLVDWLSAVERR